MLGLCGFSSEDTPRMVQISENKNAKQPGSFPVTSQSPMTAETPACAGNPIKSLSRAAIVDRHGRRGIAVAHEHGRLHMSKASLDENYIGSHLKTRF